MGFKICVVGCGNISFKGHGPALAKYARETPDVELSACCDLEGAKAERFKEAFGFGKSFTDLDDMLRSERPDAVSLFVPPSVTADIALRIVGQGYPLLVEKPPGLNKEEIYKIIAKAEEKGVPNMVAFNRRFMPVILKAREILSALSKTSTFQFIRYDMFRHGRTNKNYGNAGIHGIDTTLYLACTACTGARMKYFDLQEPAGGGVNVHLDLSLQNGGMARLDFTSASGATLETAMVVLDHNTIVVSIPTWGDTEPYGRVLHYQNDKLVDDVDGVTLCAERSRYVANGFYGEDRYFLDCIRNGVRPQHDLRTSIQSVILMNCLDERVESYSF